MSVEFGDTGHEGEGIINPSYAMFFISANIMSRFRG